MPALVLTGNLLVGASTGDAEADVLTADEMGDEVTHLEIASEVDQIEVKQTMGKPASARGGAVDYKVTVGGYSNDIDGALALALWDAVESDEGVLFLAGSLRQEPVSAANPLWTLVAQVSEASFGGEAEGLSEFTGTWGLREAPEQHTS